MKLDPQILKFARQEVSHHLLPDLAFTEELHRFLDDIIGLEEYLESPCGFRKFLFDYKVGRTLQAGNDAKLKILRIIRSHKPGTTHVDTISLLAHAIRQKKLSSKSGNGGYGLPKSFASKLLTVRSPDRLIPYDSYALKSLELRRGHRLKDLHQYYAAVEDFRMSFFQESSKHVHDLMPDKDKTFQKLSRALNLDSDRLLSLKLTDKYLWCEEYLRRKNR